MAIYHLSIKIISRGKGKSAVAAAAYRSGEKITNEYDGVTHDYTRKGGVTHTEILLPDHVPKEYTDRTTLWNAVEKIEKSKNSQLSREIELALPCELDKEQQKNLAREYCKKNFVSVGMCADICIHDKEDGNPHAHIMLTMRPIEPDGSWGAKSKKEYLLDENGEKIKLKSGEFKSQKVNAVDWNEHTKAEEWRSGWADICNSFLEQNSIDERIDHRSYERQGIEQIPTIHMGVAASQMERRGIVTDRGEQNRKIKSDNQLLKELKARINKLNTWLNEELQTEKSFDNQSNPIPSIPSIETATLTSKPSPNLIEILNGVLGGQGDKSYYKKIADLKSISKAISFLQSNDITTLPQLQEKVTSIRNVLKNVSDGLKKRDRRLGVLNEHIKNAETYRQHKEIHKQYKQLSPKKQDVFYQKHDAEILLYKAAERYLKQNMNGHTSIPINSWKSEAVQLKAERDKFFQDYSRLKEEVRDVEIIKRNVEDVTREDIPIVRQGLRNDLAVSKPVKSRL